MIKQNEYRHIKPRCRECFQQKTSKYVFIVHIIIESCKINKPELLRLEELDPKIRNTISFNYYSSEVTVE